MRTRPYDEIERAIRSIAHKWIREDTRLRDSTHVAEVRARYDADIARWKNSLARIDARQPAPMPKPISGYSRTFAYDPATLAEIV